MSVTDTDIASTSIVISLAFPPGTGLGMTQDISVRFRVTGATRFTGYTLDTTGRDRETTTYVAGGTTL